MPAVIYYIKIMKEICNLLPYVIFFYPQGDINKSYTV
jgi:hypothetical protein